MLGRCFRLLPAGLLLACVHLPLFAQDAIFGGNGGGFEDRFTQADSDAEAARFLTQATFGPSPASIAQLRGVGYQTWFDQQFAAPITSSRAYLDFLAAQPAPPTLGHSQRMDRWFHTAAFGNDQLRQRVAFALSQILVISDQNDALAGNHYGVSEYWDILARNAFGNYRELLEEVTRSPMMGIYLSHWRNRKANPSGTIQPDENYAREIMQLFTIGLLERNLDFSPVLVMGQPVPTYEQDEITELARVFTGWSYRCPNPPGGCDTYRGLTTGSGTPPNGYLPMACFPAFMDDGAKQILAGITLPAAGVTCGANNTSNGQPDTTGTPADVNVQNTCRAYCESQMEATMDYLFNHPNVAPFVSRQMIQRLVTSNPSPAYIQRVAEVFENNGQGVRGDMRALIKAVLLDEEARIAPVDPASNYGKLREPLLRLTAVWRALGVTAPATEADGEVQMGIRNPQTAFVQRPLGANTVFNFYEPDYMQPGLFTTNGWFSPEFQITNETTAITSANEMWNRIWAGYSTSTGTFTLPTTSAYLSFNDLATLATDPNNATTRTQLLDALNTRLLYGTMSTPLRTTLNDMLRFDMISLSPNQRVLNMAHLIAISPEFAVQR